MHQPSCFVGPYLKPLLGARGRGRLREHRAGPGRGVVGPPLAIGFKLALVKTAASLFGERAVRALCMRTVVRMVHVAT